MDESRKALFTKKSIDKISSPEQLDEYLKVTNPSVWLSLIGIILLLAGVFVWGVFGKLEVRKAAVAISQDGSIAVYLPAGREDIHEGIPVEIRGDRFVADDVRFSSREADSTFPEKAKEYGGFDEKEILDTLFVSEDYPEGVYRAYVVTEQISPMQLIFN